MYHPYKDGYSTLPGLRRIGPGEVWETDGGESAGIMLEKWRILESRRCYWEHDCPGEVLDEVASWVRTWHPWRPSGDFVRVSMGIPEDLLIHRVSGDRDWLAAAHVCFPSSWHPGEKIGRTWEEIHRPVPMDLSSSSRIVRAMVSGGPFERFVWGVVHDDRHDFHPLRPRSEFSLEDPFVLVKVERQVTVPFPELGCCLFILRQYLVRDYESDLLALAIEGMTPEQKSYKGLSGSGELVSWLRGLEPSS